jgi:hypothetical protein
MQVKSILRVSLTLVCYIFSGEYSLLYYYVRAKFGWTEKDYGEYAAYKAWAATVGESLY